MDNKKISSIIESILFTAGDPVGVSDIASALDHDVSVIEDIVRQMIQTRKETGSGIQIRYSEGKLQFCSNIEYFDYIEKMLRPEKTHTLSQSALETLSIIAYQQPVTRAEIEAVRGIRSNYSVSCLMEKGLIVQLGKKDVIGHPMMYGTSEAFLRHFGIGSLNELPELKKAE